MKAMIRWQGLIIFGCIAALLCFFSFFFIDGFVKRTIEKQGSALVGAKVELAEADLTFFPAGLQLSRLQITNPDKPMRNIVEIERMAMSIDPMRLLQRKIIIAEMAVEGIRPDTPRQKSGAIPGYSAQKKDAASEKSTGGKMPSLKIPDVEEVLGKETLATIELARNFQEQITADKLRWQKKLAELPNEETLAQYKERLNKLKSSGGFAGLLSGATELVAVKEELQADLDLLKTAQSDFKGVSSSYQKRLNKLKNAPQQDINRLIDKYSLSGKGLSNLSSLLFGTKAGNTVEQALSWYAKAQPLLERGKEKKGNSEIVKATRGKGVWVRFEEREPLPDFLIRNITASVLIAAGDFGGTIKNVTPDQDILGHPLSFAFAGESLQGLHSIKFDGVLDHINPEQASDTINLVIKGYSLAETKLSDDENLPVTLNSGLVDFSVHSILKQQNIDADVQAKLKSASIASTPAKQDDAISRAIAGALSEINSLSATAKITGPIDAYEIQLKSDIDKILKKAVGNTIKSQTARFEKDLKTGIMAKVKDPLAAATGSYSDFGNISQELTTRLQAGSNLL